MSSTETYFIVNSAVWISLYGGKNMGFSTTSNWFKFYSITTYHICLRWSHITWLEQQWDTDEGKQYLTHLLQDGTEVQTWTSDLRTQAAHRNLHCQMLIRWVAQLFSVASACSLHIHRNKLHYFSEISASASPARSTHLLPCENGLVCTLRIMDWVWQRWSRWKPFAYGSVRMLSFIRSNPLVQYTLNGCAFPPDKSSSKNWLFFPVTGLHG